MSSPELTKEKIDLILKELADLRRIRTLFEAIINSTHDAISVVDEHGIGILINPAYTKLTGLTKEQVINQPATVDIAEGESTHLQVLRTRRPVRGVRLKVGPAKKEVMVNVAPVLVDGELKGSVGVIHDLTEIKKLTEELEQTKRLLRTLEAKYTFEDIVGASLQIKTAVEQAQIAAATTATVLLRGESGTGKELFAHAIHNASTRRAAGFIRINCGSFPENLLESELFGYEEGSFTGALRGGKAGIFEQAHGGTIFMDEIGEISLHVQTSLLRVLQEKEIRRVGSSKTIPVDVRIIAATNANLEQKLKEGKFREDLYYRINVLPVYIPPLRERKEDILYLCECFVQRFNREYGRKVVSLQPEVIAKLQQYHWPGNVRELANVIARSVINMKVHEEVITLRHLPQLEHKFQHNFGYNNLEMDNFTPGQETLEMIVQRVEKQVILKTLAACKGNKTKTAQMLGLSVRNLYYKIEKLGLDLTS